ncbi:MAG: ATP-dependent DNA helicase [Nitrospirae bacterium]|nr:MAG: ATP-dependent DNA helicase [Nitrospirota bacterium]
MPEHANDEAVQQGNLAHEAELFLNETVLPALPEHEVRASQTAMMAACSGTIRDGGILLAESGTGTGKTFAYLIPLILSGRKAIITTRTKNLQEQLVSKDLAFLSTLRQFSYAIAKGRSNYLCLRRLRAFSPQNEDEDMTLKALRAWSEETESGDLGELRERRSPLLDRVCSDGDACKKMNCGFYRECHYFRARRKWELSQIIVANHALLAVNAMMTEESAILPQAEVLVVDEGHALDNALSDQIGINLSRQRAESLLNRFLRLDERGAYKGLLSRTPSLFGPVEALRESLGLLWNRVAQAYKNRTMIQDLSVMEAHLLENAEAIRSLAGAIKASALGLFEEDEELEMAGALAKLAAFADEMELYTQARAGYVRWAEIEERKVSLRMAPVYPKEFVKDNILPGYRSLILTSATLSVCGDFSLIQTVLGLEEAARLSLPSPFDMRQQVSVRVSRGINLREDEGAAMKLAAVITAEAEKADGGMLVLFTSRASMNRTWDLASGRLQELGVCPMLQGDIPNRAMLEAMRESTNSVIFGLDSFWEGVDVKGDALKCLIIAKLPFEVPTEPMVLARMEEIRRSGGNPFNDYSLPRAILKFKQGFGRLIRSAQDTGRVVICDDRIETKQYGRKFMESIY